MRTSSVLYLLLPAAYNLSRTAVEARRTQWAVPAGYTDRFGWVKASQLDNYEPIRSGKSVLDCYTNMEVYPAPDLSVGPLVPELGGLKSEWERWNVLDLAGRSEKGSIVRLNFNHSPYWSFQGHGAEIVSRLRERLAVKLTDDHIDGKLVFSQPGAREGIWISLVGCLIVAGLGIWAFHRG